MKFLPPNTLARFEAMPQKRRLDLSQIELAGMAAATKAYRENCGLVSPDVRALEFYAMNHLYSLVSKRFTKNEPLPKWAQQICEVYHDILVGQGERLMHYLISIITREIRHLDHDKLMKYYAQAEALSNKETVEFLKENLNAGESSAVQAYMDKPPAVTALKYVRAVEYLFNNGWPKSTSFGGVAWGGIARCLGDFLEGKTSMEMMVDTSYTLAHNNGPMFNKGMMYSNYTGYFVQILDVQRSGQIPELVKTRAQYKWMSFNIANLASIVDLAYQHLSEDLGEYVDWYKVEDLGSVKKYPQEKQKQDEKYPKPKPPTMFKGMVAHEVGVFQVTPGEEVKVYKREVAA